jgi:serine/threonine protein kinase
VTIWLQPGDDFGDYRVVSCVSSGGQANIYQACNKTDLSEVCLKVFRDRLPGDESSQRLISHYKNLRGRIGQDFSHYAYVPYEIGVIEGELVASMFWSRGVSLRTLLGSSPTWAVRFRIAERLSNVVRWLHKVDLDRGKASRIVHLDLKPENILIEFAEENGETKPFLRLIDFDNARLDGIGAIDELLGSPYYRSPEQGRARLFADLKWPEKADVFSLCVILFELLFGKRPYQDKAFDVESGAYRVDIEGLEELQVSRSLQRTILLGLHPRPEERPLAGRIHSELFSAFECSGLAMEGSGMDRWVSPRSFVARLTQTPGFERVYRFEDGPTAIGFHQLAGAAYLPVDRDFSLELLPSPVGWYVRPKSREVEIRSGPNRLTDGAGNVVEILAGSSYQVHFGMDSRFVLRLSRL